MGFYYRSWLKNRGFPQDQFDGRPVHRHLQHLV
jgi:dihydroxy-acid dehydratase